MRPTLPATIVPTGSRLCRRSGGRRAGLRRRQRCHRAYLGCGLGCLRDLKRVKALYHLVLFHRCFLPRSSGAGDTSPMMLYTGGQFG